MHGKDARLVFDRRRNAESAAPPLVMLALAAALAAVLATATGCRAMLGQSADVARQSQLLKSLDSASADVRVAALEDLQSLGAAALPESVGELIQDGDPRVRRAAVAVIAARNHPDAHNLLLTALEDPDVQVRLAAVAGLGQSADVRSRLALENILAGDTETMRAAAAAALAAQGAFDVVQDVADDKSWRVREAVAAGLARDASNRAAELAVQMVADRSAQVQQRAVEAVAAWPLDLAGPVLLTAAASPAYMTSKLAAEQLAQRWPQARTLPAEPPQGLSPGQLAAWRTQRERHVAELRDRWIAEYGDRLLAAANAQARNVAVRVASPQAIAHAERLVDALADAGQAANESKATLDALRAMGPELLAVADAWACDEAGRAMPEAVFTEVLPAVAPAIATINGLASDDVSARRAAAGKLAEVAAAEGLSPSAFARLTSVVEKEKDLVVWQQILRSAAETPGELPPAARRLAALALSHTDAEVRRRGCETVAAWRDPRMTPLLVASLTDANAAVVHAAARSFAALGAGDDPRPLLPLLTAGDRALRLSAAEALTRSRYREGVDALERLAADADTTVRRQAALAIGRTRDANFTPLLVRLLDDRSPVQQAALDSLVAIHGEDIGRSRQGPGATVADRVARWKAWHAERTGRG
jgi:HEAT repeat protein